MNKKNEIETLHEICKEKDEAIQTAIKELNDLQEVLEKYSFDNSNIVLMISVMINIIESKLKKIKERRYEDTDSIDKEEDIEDFDSELDEDFYGDVYRKAYIKNKKIKGEKIC